MACPDRVDVLAVLFLCVGDGSQCGPINNPINKFGGLKIRSYL